MTKREPSYRKGLDVDPQTVIDTVDGISTIVQSVGDPQGVVDAGQHTAQQIGANVGQSVGNASQQVAEYIGPATPAHQMLSSIKGLKTKDKNP